MRYPLARVVLGVCLCAAAAAAQAPATPSTQGAQGSSSGSSAGGSAPGPSSLGSSSLGAVGSRLYEPQDQDYSLSTLFRQSHGEFMDRRERYNPSIELRGRVQPNGSVKGEPGQFDLYGYDFDAELPAVIATESYLIFGAYQYGRRYVTSNNFGSNNNPPGVNFGDETLTAVGLRFGFGVFLHDNLLLEMKTNPGIYSDFETGLTHKDYDYYSSALFTWRAANSFFFKFGARYNQVYYNAPWLPYLGFSWEIADGLRLDVLAPESVELSYWPSASTGFLLGTQVSGYQYSVSTGTAFGRQRADLQVQEIVSYLGLVERFGDHVSLTARVGSAVAGDYRLTTGAAAFDPITGALNPRFYADITFGIDW